MAYLKTKDMSPIISIRDTTSSRRVKSPIHQIRSVRLTPLPGMLKSVQLCVWAFLFLTYAVRETGPVLKDCYD